jgi:excisionase family DNA binding protein
MKEPLLSVGDVARYLGVSQKSVRRRSLELGGYLVVGRLRFERELVDRWLAEQQLARPRRKGGAAGLKAS